MNKLIIAIVPLLAFSLILGTLGCGGNDEETPLSPTPSDNATSGIVPSVDPTPTDVTESRVITIGNHTDVTGASSFTMNVITMALEDLTRYYNEHNLVPGVRFEVLTYDGQFDPSLDIPGYEWLIENGADFIFTPVPSTVVALKNRAQVDEKVVFTVALADEALEIPGWVFSAGNTLGKAHAYTGLEWIFEIDEDFPRDRPAKIGGTFWTGLYSEGVLAAAQKYCEAHPDRFEFVGGYLVEPKFLWDEEVEALKDCDFVLPPAPMNQFVKQYREAGYTAKFIGTDWHIAALNSIDEAGLWDEINGMLVIRPVQWWNDEGAIIDLTKSILYEYRPDQAEDIIQSGSGYLSMQQIYLMFELISDTITAVGPELFDSRAVYNTAQSFSMVIDGCSHSFTETKRTSNDDLASYEVRAAEEDMFRREPGPIWHPVLWSP